MLRSSFLVGVAASALFAGCANNTGDTTVLILHNQAPAAGCLTTADQGGATLSSGLFDLTVLRQFGVTNVEFGYKLTPTAINDSFADPAQVGAIARRTFIVQGAHVDIAFTDTNGLSQADQDQLAAMGLTHFDARFGGAIMPNGGLASFSFEVIPAPIMTAILAKYPAPTNGSPYDPFPDIHMVATIQLFGDMNGGQIESSIFDYPVTACDGCLTTSLGLCSTVPTTFMPAHTGGACLLGQDGAVDCCVDDATLKPVCPAVGTMTP